MAKVTLPLLGVSAHGMLAKQLVYRTRPEGTTASVWKGKRDAKSEAQLARRRKFWEAKEVWPFVDGEKRAEFAEAAATAHLTAWNHFVSLVLDGTISGGTVGESSVGGADMVWIPPCPW